MFGKRENDDSENQDWFPFFEDHIGPPAPREIPEYFLRDNNIFPALPESRGGESLLNFLGRNIITRKMTESAFAKHVIREGQIDWVLDDEAFENPRTRDSQLYDQFAAEPDHQHESFKFLRSHTAIRICAAMAVFSIGIPTAMLAEANFNNTQVIEKPALGPDQTYITNPEPPETH